MGWNIILSLALAPRESRALYIYTLCEWRVWVYIDQKGDRSRRQGGFRKFCQVQEFRACREGAEWGGKASLGIVLHVQRATWTRVNIEGGVKWVISRFQGEKSKRENIGHARWYIFSVRCVRLFFFFSTERMFWKMVLIFGNFYVYIYIYHRAINFAGAKCGCIILGF